MSDPTWRVLRLLFLLQTHRAWSGPAGQPVVPERALRRDIGRLRELGDEVFVRRGSGRGGDQPLESWA